MQSPRNKENTSFLPSPFASPSKGDRSRTSSNDSPLSSIEDGTGCTSSTVPASSQDLEVARNVPASYSEVLFADANAALNETKGGTTGSILAIDGASRSSRLEIEGTRVASTLTSTSTPAASSNGNASLTPISGSISSQGQQLVHIANEKASSESNVAARGSPFTTSQSDGVEKNLTSRLATISEIEGRPNAAEEVGDNRLGLDSTSQPRTLTTDQDETTESLPTAATQPTRGETDTPSLSPSDSTSGVGMTTFNTSGSMSIFDSRASPLSTSSLASTVSQNFLIEGEEGKEDEVKAEAFEPSSTSSATEGGFEGKIGEIEAFVDGKGSVAKAEDSEEEQRENVSGGAAKSPNASSNLSEHAKKEISTDSASLDQGGKQIESSPTRSSARSADLNRFDTSSQPSSSKRQASNQDLSIVGAHPDPHESDLDLRKAAISASDQYIDKYYKDYAQGSQDSPPPIRWVLQAGLLLQFIEAIENSVFASLNEFRNRCVQVDVDNSVGLIQAGVNQFLSDAKKDSENILLGIPTLLDKKDFTLPESQEEKNAELYEWDQLKRVDPEVRKALLGVLQRIRSVVIEMDEPKTLLKEVKVADVLWRRTLSVFDKYRVLLEALGWNDEIQRLRT